MISPRRSKVSKEKLAGVILLYDLSLDLYVFICRGLVKMTSSKWLATKFSASWAEWFCAHHRFIPWARHATTPEDFD